MKRKFSFYFDDPRLVRKYSFDINFSSKEKLESAIDWAETTEDISKFIKEMNVKFGHHEITYDPDTELIGFESYNILPRYYIRVMTKWHDFFRLHKLDCSDIEEVSLDKRL